jgi:hypothetical protein
MSCAVSVNRKMVQIACRRKKRRRRMLIERLTLLRTELLSCRGMLLGVRRQMTYTN